ncbi:MAG TPA: hypothetical protein VL688_12550, partial [Verrucomicrobiae bacterium]|nr:hypothetical protein [Verrucomicrobiae bacterium]
MPLIAAFLVFIAVSAVAGVVLATFAGVLTVAVSCYALAAGMLAALLAFRSCRGISLEGPGPGFFDKAALFFAFLFCARNFFWLYYYSGEKVYTLNGYPYADLHFHLAFIQNFVSDTPFWPENPLFTGAPLRYHFGMDLFTALFVKAGLPLTRALPLIGFFGGMLTMLALYAWGRGFTVAAFLFTGGMAGYVFFLTHVFDDYQSQLAWKNVALTSLLPQRGFLFGFPAGLVTLWSWRRRILENKKGLPLWIEGLLWGVMPFFQMHAFMFLSGIFALWTVAKKKIRDMMPVYFVALVTAVPFVLILTDNFQKASMIWFKPGWMMETQNPVIFFMLNFGLYCPLALWTAWRVARSRERNAQLMLFPALALFLLCMFVMFGPWEWDNTKLIIWSFLLATPVFDAYVVRRLRFPFRALLLVGLFASGFVCVVSSMGKNNRGIPIVDRQDLDEVCAQMAKIAPTAHVASAQEAYHPVLMCGRKLAAGYAGNLRAAFGLDPENVEAKLQRLMAGEFDWRSLARDLNARY